MNPPPRPPAAVKGPTPKERKFSLDRLCPERGPVTLFFRQVIDFLGRSLLKNIFQRCGNWLAVLVCLLGLLITVGRPVEKPSSARNKVLTESGFSLDSENVSVFDDSGKQQNYFARLYALQLRTVKKSVGSERSELNFGVFSWRDDPSILVHRTAGKSFFIGDPQILRSPRTL